MRISHLLLFTVLTSGAAQAQLIFRSATNPTKDTAAEIISYTSDGYRVAATYAHTTTDYGVILYTMDSTGTLSEQGVVNFNGAFAAGDVTSTALDPLQRKFGVVALKPAGDSSTTVGKIGFFDYTNGAILGSVDVGYHPDNVVFSRDGTKILVANEAENGTATSRPGSMSVIDISSLGVSPTPANIAGLSASTYDFSAGNLGSGASTAPLRVVNQQVLGSVVGLPGPQDPVLEQIEPEYIASFGNKAYVSLQENNGIGVFDLTTGKWENIYSLGTITQTIDASDRDNGSNGPSFKVDDVVRGMPMPDTMAAFNVAGQTFLVTANEGDALTNDADSTRLGAGGVSDPNLAGVIPNSILGRLNVSRIDGDTDANGKINIPTMFGTRSFSIWDADTGALVYDSGSLETLLFGLDPTMHNSEDGTPSNFDGRSDNKGPEPEALTILDLGERKLLAVGMERQNGLLLYDITNPAAPVFLGYTNTSTDSDLLNNFLVSPESMLAIRGTDNPTGLPLFLTGFELNNGGIGVFSIPEPSRFALAGLASLLLITHRRRA